MFIAGSRTFLNVTTLCVTHRFVSHFHGGQKDEGLGAMVVVEKLHHVTLTVHVDSREDPLRQVLKVLLMHLRTQ
jgi:hypothetical protein